MKFKRGSQVEVLSKDEVPFGAWYPAEIVWGNGRYYNVKYDNASCIGSGEVTEKVSRKVLRPVPSRVEGVKSWTIGDVVEAFIVCSWRVAMIVEIFSRNYFHVKVLGCFEEYRVHISNIRVRQSWQDDKWAVIAKDSGSSDNLKFGKVPVENRKSGVPSLISRGKTKLHGRYDCIHNESNTGFEESHSIPFRTLKRASPYQSYYLDLYAGKCKKMRMNKEKSEDQRVITRYQSTPLNKVVDIVAHTREKLGITCMHTSCSNQTLGFYEKEKRKQNRQINCSFALTTDLNDSNSDASSVGSCSVVSYSPDKLLNHKLAVSSREADVLSSDAESFIGHGDLDEKCTSLPKEDLSENIHRIELYAYKRTLGALYASGPLSWEQEELLTNFRLSLHISNNEHLLELRNLISGGINALAS